MIDPRTRATMFILGLFVLAFVINMMRTRKLQERYALLWVLAAVGLVLAPLGIPLIDDIAYRLGVAYPPALILALAVIALMLIVLQLSLTISHEVDHVKVLTQELGLLRQELEALRAQVVPDGLDQIPAGRYDPTTDEGTVGLAAGTKPADERVVHMERPA